MKEVHCRKCWQPVSRLTRRCAQCGQLDLMLFGKGMIEILIYVAVGAVALGLSWWAISLVIHSSAGSSPLS